LNKDLGFNECELNEGILEDFGRKRVMIEGKCEVNEVNEGIRKMVFIFMMECKEFFQNK